MALHLFTNCHTTFVNMKHGSQSEGNDLKDIITHHPIYFPTEPHILPMFLTNVYVVIYSRIFTSNDNI